MIRLIFLALVYMSALIMKLMKKREQLKAFLEYIYHLIIITMTFSPIYKLLLLLLKAQKRVMKDFLCNKP